VTETRTLRVAIYCRKSVADRNGTDFGSIDAQREAIQAFVLSQRGEGWVALPARYDDDGCSGSNTDRPAFQRILGDVKEGHVDVIAVYKIDRLSRSLTDFARLIDFFEEHNVTFVAVTQQFNTATSMGRLTLNILMSFAEFERQVISERTADKMLATRKRGKWTGGPVPLGYDLRDKRLVVNRAEATNVRLAFETFVETGSLVRTLEALTARGCKTRRGKPLSRAVLVTLLRSPLYCGGMRAGDEIVKAEHEAIVDPDIWQRAQEILDGNKRAQREKRPSEALLAGLISCGKCGAAMSPTHTRRRGRLYNYYQCGTTDKRGAAACPGGRVPAGPIEQIVVDRIRAIGQDPELVEATVEAARVQLDQERAEADRRLADLLTRQEELVSRRRVALDGLTANGSDQRATHEALGALTAEMERVEAELRDAQDHTHALTGAEVREDEIRSALASFSELWDELFPRERARLVSRLVEEVTYDPATDEVEIRFRPEGFALVAGRQA
jgi:site-specific DNA recombinase